MEVASDDSTAAGSLFTRYTARTTASRGSAASGCVHSFQSPPAARTESACVCRNTARSHRRQVIKELAGKKDTIYEDIYIYSSLSKLVTLRLEEFRGALCRLWPILT